MPRPGRGPMGRVNEKSKDFVGSMKRLIKSLDKWRYLLAFGLVLALASAILAIIAPNILSDFAGVIQDGISPNEDKTKEVATLIGENYGNSLSSLSNPEIMATLTEEELVEVNEYILNLTSFKEEHIKSIGFLSANILSKILTDIEIDGTVISVEDQINYFKTLVDDKNNDLPESISNLVGNENDKLENIHKTLINNYATSLLVASNNPIFLSTLDENEVKELTDYNTKVMNDNREAIGNVVLSDGILQKVLTDVKYDGTVISAEDQIVFLNLVKDMDANNTDMAVLMKMLEELPDSIYDIIQPAIDMEAVKNTAILLGSVYVLSALFSYIEHFIMATISNNFAKKLRTNITEKINKLPLKYFDQHETGDVLSRVTNDVDQIGFNMNQSLGSLVASTTLFLGSIVMMFVTNWIMAVTAILASIVGFFFMFMLLGKSQKYFNQRQIELGNLNGYIEEIYSGHNVVKAYNGDKEAINEFNDLNNHLYDCNRKSQFLSGVMQPIMGFVGNLGYVAVCVVGAILTMKDIIDFPVIVAFMIYVRLFTNPLSQIAQAMTSLQSTAAAAERVFEFLDEKEMATQEDKRKRLDKSKVKGEIEFKSVKFGYDPGRTIIKNFSAKALPGQKIAIVGPTGAGKTTMVNLLMKFYEINDGDILIDGVSTKDMTRENIHDLFVMVLQDTWLFEGSVRDNIKFNKEDVTDEEIWNACRVVGIDHFVKTLPGGLNSELGDDTSVSQGQKQLLTIARGMIEDAPFLILDEATSNVDTRTEELVQKAMDKLTEGRTSFIIAHRLSTIKNADLILVMNEGNIIEQGTHEELLELGGFYEKLYNSQFEKTV